jgi:O-antigen/teichoic acid export membrane protein
METKTIVNRLLSGSVLKAFLLLCNIAVSFFMMPFLIHKLGDRWYGFWTLVGTFIGYYGFLDLGFSSAVSRYISRAYGQDDNLEINIIINTSIVLFCFIGFIAMIITFIITWLAPYFIHSQSEIPIFRKVILLLGISVSLGFPMRAFAGILNSKVRYDLAVYVELVKLLVRTTLIFFYLSKGYGIVTLTIITFFVDVFGHANNFFFAIREFPEMSFKKKYIVLKRIKELFSYSKYTFISQISDILRFKIDSLVIAFYLDLSMITLYSIALRLIEYFIRLITNTIGLLTPVFSQFEGRGDFDSIKKIFISATRISSIVTFYVGGCIIFYGSYFIHVWLGHEYNEKSYPVLVILCISVMLGLMQNPSIGLLYGISKHRFYAISNLCEGILNLSLSIILVQFYGIYGVALGTMIEMVIIKVFVLPIYICKLLNLVLIDYYCRTILLPLIKIIGIMMIYFYFAKDIIKYSYSSIILIALFQFILSLPIIFFGVLEREERYLLKIGFKRKV